MRTEGKEGQKASLRCMLCQRAPKLNPTTVSGPSHALIVEVSCRVTTGYCRLDDCYEGQGPWYQRGNIKQSTKSQATINTYQHPSTSSVYSYKHSIAAVSKAQTRHPPQNKCTTLDVQHTTVPNTHVRLERSPMHNGMLSLS